MLGTSRVVAAVLTTLVVSAPVRAQPGPATDKQKQQAGELVKQAIAKSKAKAHAEAIALYLEAYGILPLPTLLSNVGTEYQQDDKPGEALRYFCMYLDKDPGGTLATYATTQARALQDALGTEVADDDPCTPLAPPAPPAAEPTSPAPAGLTATHAPARAPDPGKALRRTGLVSGVVGLAALGVGVYAGRRAQTISDDIENHPTGTPWRNDILAYEAEGQRFEHIQIATLIAGGALVVTGTTLYLLGRAKTSSAERLTVAPLPARDGGGVVFAGRF